MLCKDMVKIINAITNKEYHIGSKVPNKDNFRRHNFMMQDIGLINGYEIFQLSIRDNSIVEELCNKCSDYFILNGGTSPSKEHVVYIDKV